MAVFNQDYAGNISNIKDLASLQAYLQRQQEQIRYMFENLTPDDNFSASAKAEYDEIRGRD